MFFLYGQLHEHYFLKKFTGNKKKSNFIFSKLQP
jgi:hypothetical protein